MNDKITNINELKNKVAEFIKERDWKQFHSPKNLSMSIAIEAAELMEKFQWCDTEKSKEEVKKNKNEISHEIADIASYLLSFCYFYDIDLSKAIEQKIELNKLKYPVEQCKGKTDKYTKYLELKKNKLNE